MIWRGRKMLAVVGLLGAVVGVLGWGGFNWAMEATNAPEFCISCHAMRDTVYPEYKRSVHYSNPSGVRAVCADCHVPRDWTHKVLRKVAATREVYHWLLGSIDTAEKFEAKRHTLARREWDRMRASDSRECRNCHSYDAMDFHRQTAKASRAMTDAAKAGKTCIDCHKGIAHAFPDVDAGHRSTFAALTAAAAPPAPGGDGVTLRSLDFRLTADGEAPAAGALFPGAAVKILTRDGERVQAEVVGWRRDGLEETLFARMGKRMPLATLNSAATPAETLEETEDPDTGMIWRKVKLSVWTAAAGSYAAEAGAVWRYGAEMYDATCTLCHAAYPPDRYAANDWVGHMNAMRRLTKLTEEEGRLLLAYVQNAARDVKAVNP